MAALDLSGLPPGAPVLVDTAPIIYCLEGHKALAPHFMPLFDRQAAGELEFAVTTIAMAEVLTGPSSADEEVLVKRYRAVLETWQVVPLTHDRDFSTRERNSGSDVSTPIGFAAAEKLRH